MKRQDGAATFVGPGFVSTNFPLKGVCKSKPLNPGTRGPVFAQTRRGYSCGGAEARKAPEKMEKGKIEDGKAARCRKLESRSNWERGTRRRIADRCLQGPRFESVPIIVDGVQFLANSFSGAEDDFARARRERELGAAFAVGP